MPRLFDYDNGELYFPVGENMCWFNGGGAYGEVNYSRPGRFNLRLNEVSAFGSLTFALDGRTLKELNFNAALPADKSVAPEYAWTANEQDYGIYRAAYDPEIFLFAIVYSAESVYNQIGQVPLYFKTTPPTFLTESPRLQYPRGVHLL